jgi:cytochrome c peroxidase
VFERTTNNRGEPIEPEWRCVNCHAGPHKTSLRSSGVGTDMWFDAPAVDVPAIDLRNEDSLGPLGIVYFAQDPTRFRPMDDAHLRGIRGSPPYLHNGAAATLEEIWTKYNLYDWHGITGDLTRRQFNDLIEYMKTL